MAVLLPLNQVVSFQSEKMRPTGEHRPAGDLRTTVDHRPTEDYRPTEDLRPAVDHRPSEDHRPAEDLRPTVDNRPTVDHRPAGDLRTTVDHRPTEDYRPTEDLRPAVDHRPTEDHRPAIDHRPTEDLRPSVDYRPTEDLRPSVDYRPAVYYRPTEDHRKAEDLRPAEELRPSVDPNLLTMSNSVVFEDEWARVYTFGVYQCKQMVLTILAALPMAFHIVSVIFIGYTPEHQCSLDLQEKPAGGISSVNNSINTTAGTCSISWLRQNVDGQVTTEETACLYGHNYSTPKTYTFVTEWDLVCERDAVGRLSQSLVLGGMFLGALAAPLADKYGRKLVHVAFNIGLLTVTFTMAFVKDETVFLVLRFFIGTFQQGMLLTVVTFWLELLHRDSRENVGIVNAFMWGSSVMVLTLVAFLLQNYDWRILQLALSLFSVISIVEIFLMDESLRWLVVNNRKVQSSALISKIWKQNKVRNSKLPEGAQNNQEPSISLTESMLALRTDILPDQITDKVKEKWSKLLTDKIMRRHSIIIWGVWVANNFTYYGIVMMTPSFAGGRYLNFFLGSTSELIGNFILFLFIKKFTRKTTIVTLQAVGSVALLLTILTNHFESDVMRVVEMGLFAVSRGAICNSFNAIYLYTPELFPTNLRNAGLGVASAAGRISGFIAPFTVYMVSLFQMMINYHWSLLEL
ncbi:organic cation transporter protein-like [Ylistrum balloti]|uniref:organic cation transporter protein-like n=1 Tax=Ylistrum balloti TaxID=509963 RepID=UPI002905F377|nr:organic cation transporter protein-like [Ylistrum balloti]